MNVASRLSRELTKLGHFKCEEAARRQAGRQLGWKAGKEEGRKEGRKAERQKGRKAERQKGRKAGRQEDWMYGWQDGRRERNADSMGKDK